MTVTDARYKHEESINDSEHDESFEIKNAPLLIMVNKMLILNFQTIKYRSDRTMLLSALLLVDSFVTVNCTSTPEPLK